MSSNEKTLSEPLTEEERQLIEALRQWQGSGRECSLSIGLSGGAWDISLSESLPGKELSGRGVGKTFDEAWANVEPLWA